MMGQVAPTGKKAKQYHNFAQKRERGGAKPDGDDDDNDEDEPSGASINMADVLQFWSAMMGGAAARGSSSSSSFTSTAQEKKSSKPKIEEIDVDDEGVALLDEEEEGEYDERIEKWSKRFEGKDGARLLEQLCGLVDVDPSQPRPVVLKELAKVRTPHLTRTHDARHPDIYMCQTDCCAFIAALPGLSRPQLVHQKTRRKKKNMFLPHFAKPNNNHAWLERFRFFFFFFYDLQKPKKPLALVFLLSLRSGNSTAESARSKRTGLHGMASKSGGKSMRLPSLTLRGSRSNASRLSTACPSFVVFSLSPAASVCVSACGCDSANALACEAARLPLTLPCRTLSDLMSSCSPHKHNVQ